MQYFTVIDTETNWEDKVMSIGAVIADRQSFNPIAFEYYIIAPEHKIGGMFSDTLLLSDPELNIEYGRQEALHHLQKWLDQYNVSDLYAYNASFDYNHLPEMSAYYWYDIMRLAANRNHNKKIPITAECHGTGRLKRNYGVEPMLRLLSNNSEYSEQHNALTDAFDELKIMELLAHKPENYTRLK